jgi:hypothetical protein
MWHAIHFRDGACRVTLDDKIEHADDEGVHCCSKPTNQ